MPREPEMIEIEKISVTNKKEKEKAKAKAKAKAKINVPGIYDSILETLKEKVSVITIRPNTIHLVIKYVMELIEESPIKGVEQKELALKLMRALIVDLTEGEDELVLLKLLDDNTIGNMIDLIVDASKGKLDINTAAKVTTGCIKHCVPYFFPPKKN